jgi:predicted flavoprotein YhiN
MPPDDLLIIGAGPAGLAAAIAAAERGSSVTVLEKNELPGRKLLLTGGGRCNLLDPAVDPLDTLDAFGRAGGFYRDAFRSFDVPAFFRRLGVEIVSDPATGMRHVKGGAKRMLDALLGATGDAGVNLRTGCRVLEVRRAHPSGFDVTILRSSEDSPETFRRPVGESPRCHSEPPDSSGERGISPRPPVSRGTHGNTRGQIPRLASLAGDDVLTQGVAYPDRLILATGGMTWPQTGSTGDAYPWLAALGHRIEPPRPALGALATRPCFEDLAGLSPGDVELTLLAAGRRVAVRRGALLFTHRGISGPAPLDLSLDAARLKREVSLDVALDFLPNVSREKLRAWLARRGSRRASKALDGAPFDAQIPSRLISTLLAQAAIDPASHLDHVSDRQLRNLADSLKKLTLSVVGLEDRDQAIVTLGGVSTKDVDPRTMQSRIVPGLFFAGELIDPAGTCGGYNLLQAFATGRLAGTAVTGDR